MLQVWSQIIQKRTYTVSCGYKTLKKAGVSIILSPRCKLLNWNSIINGQLLEATVQIDGQTLHITTCYCPDESKSEHGKQAFWRELEKHLKNGETPGVNG